ncbi:MAG: hypothetical protein KDD35_01705 [Bdellovibrionales bacterium]|nr:hypothetical protein [Bdellovibrionales bacterium]
MDFVVAYSHMKSGFTFFLVACNCWFLLACASGQSTGPTRQVASTYKASKHRFLEIYSKFLQHPTINGLHQMRQYILSDEGQGDKYLIAYKTQRRFADKFFAQIVKNVEQGDVSTVRSLFYLAYDLGENNLDLESRTISSEIMNNERGRRLRTVKSAEYLAAVHISYNSPELLIKALGQELVSNPRSKIYAKEIAEFGLNDDKFKPLCPQCPHQPISFGEQKFQKLISVKAKDDFELKIQNFIRESRLAKVNESPILQLRRLIFEPHDKRIAELKAACYHKSSPSADKPNIKDLGDMVNQKIVDALQKGDLEVARALVVVSNERCWEEIDNLDGPKAWLATTLICRHPHIFIQAASMENPNGLFFEEIMKFKSPQALLNCSGQAIGPNDVQHIRVEKIKSAEVVTKAEKAIVDYLVSKFDQRSPALESKPPPQ